jgi:hypothetical protein
MHPLLIHARRYAAKWSWRAESVYVCQGHVYRHIALKSQKKMASLIVSSTVLQFVCGAMLMIGSGGCHYPEFEEHYQ